MNKKVQVNSGQVLLDKIMNSYRQSAPIYHNKKSCRIEMTLFESLIFTRFLVKQCVSRYMLLKIMDLSHMCLQIEIFLVLDFQVIPLFVIFFNLEADKLMAKYMDFFLAGLMEMKIVIEENSLEYFSKEITK